MNTRPPSLTFNVEALEQYLASSITCFRGPIAVQQFVHGQSNPTYLLECGSNRYVLRRKPPGRLLPSAHAVDREFRVMRALLPTDVPVPRTLCYCDDESVIGSVFYVMEYVEGRIFQDLYLDSIPASGRTAIYDELNRVIAALHRVEPANVGLGDFGKHGGYVARQVARWTKQYRASETRRIDAMERLIEWLPQHIPAEQPSRVTHGDYRLDNVIFHPREPRILAVIDWELATLGDPMADFVYHCMPWRLPSGSQSSLTGRDVTALGIPTEPEYVRRYCERTGRASFEHFDFYMAFSMFRLAAFLQEVAARALQGIASSERAEEAGRRAGPMAEAAWAQAELASQEST
jgi:aminoglycoside phosphotransferase (APT) family kinase protein